MDKLVILDYSNAKVHIYNTDFNLTEVDESYIESLGFNSNDCSWMVGDLDVQLHKGVLIDV